MGANSFNTGDDCITNGVAEIVFRPQGICLECRRHHLGASISRRLSAYVPCAQTRQLQSCQEPLFFAERHIGLTGMPKHMLQGSNLLGVLKTKFLSFTSQKLQVSVSSVCRFRNMTNVE